MSQSNKQIAVAQLKQFEAELIAQLNGVQAAIAALGGGSKAPVKGKAKAAAATKRKGGGGGMTPGIQAALDARAVKSGKATPEQAERHAARVAAKAAKGPQAVPEGASLAEAAAS